MKKIVDLSANSAELKPVINEVANQIAESENTNLETLYYNIQDQLNSNNQVTKAKGLKAAAAFVGQLTQLVLKQTIEHINPNYNRFDIIKHFRNESFNEGNSAQFILPLNTGTESYSDTPFVPNKHTDPLIEVKQIDFFQKNGNLTDNAYQYHKPLSIRAHEWVPYFKANTLTDFVATIKAHISESIELLKIASGQKFIKELNLAKKVTDATSTNAYEAFIEFFKNVQNCYDFNIDYNINGTSQNVKPSNRENLLIFINKNTLNILRNGIKTRMFKSELFDLETLFNADNVVSVGSLLKHDTDSSTAIVVDAGDIIEDNKIKVVDKRALLQFSKLFFSGEQLYNQNMTLQIDLHYWYKLDFLGWYKGFEFTADSLKVLPA